MLNIGTHLSISKGFSKTAEMAIKIGANTFQYFSRNPRGGSVKDLDLNDINKFKQIVDENNFAPILCHAPYTYNLCSATEDTRDFARKSLREDLERLELLPIHLYNFHPGSHVGLGVDKGIEYIVEILNEVIRSDMSSIILLETMAGKGTEIGSNFEEIKRIIDGVTCKDKIGVCMDTCHVFSAGYDIVNDLDGVIDKFDKVIGLDKLKAIHLNDSMMPFGKNKDRHAEIGSGEIGMEAILNIVSHKRLEKLPFFLETPLDEKGHKEEIIKIRELIKGRKND
ncbi:deoxyribonuclease IV [Sedimentibacter sp. zth1]|uniref:deoxyribonuclease IV n=1 Tax=Sedimentibacter sp. zth1 TaxID=2816908 RepID=UPI001A934CC9|nr:deoxyribonuclease IV [Sedimentibacter sp. zth1]QSX06415.1 deoxyribonuclease IV [Sedimentibacter sp. zth1]